MDSDVETPLISPDEKLIDLYQCMNTMLGSVNHDMQQIERNIRALVSHSSNLEPYFNPLLICLANMNEKYGILKDLGEAKLRNIITVHPREQSCHSTKYGLEEIRIGALSEEAFGSEIPWKLISISLTKYLYKCIILIVMVDLDVIVGNWVEERVKCPPGKNYHFPKEKNYNVLMSEIIRKEDFCFNKRKSITGSMTTILPHDHLKNCKENMTTTTDLAYNHYPKTRCSPVNINNEFYRFPNSSNCVENLTSWGLSEEKQAEWACALDLSNRMVTSFQYDFLTPTLQDYVKERKFTNSSFTKSFRGLKK